MLITPLGSAAPEPGGQAPDPSQPGARRWEIQEYDELAGEWRNWWSNEDDGTPVTYATRQEAIAELIEEHAAMQEAVERGDMEDCPSLKDLRVAPVMVQPRWEIHERIAPTGAWAIKRDISGDPVTYGSRQEAQEAVIRHLDSLVQDYLADRKPAPPSPDDFRVAQANLA